MAGIRWYSTAPDLSTQERGTIGLPAALALVDDYLAKLKPGYATGEEALANTMFGFCRSDADFIEVCLHTPTEISLRVELPPAQGLIGKLRGARRAQRTLNSAASLKRCVSAYFTMSGDEFEKYLASEQATRED
jgi:hypothetical protein